jgi:hypothetical protein
MADSLAGWKDILWRTYARMGMIGCSQSLPA